MMFWCGVPSAFRSGKNAFANRMFGTRLKRVVAVSGYAFNYGRRMLNCHLKDSLWKRTRAMHTTQSFSWRHRTGDKRRTHVAVYVVLGSRR
jgi:hypothetical protein